MRQSRKLLCRKVSRVQIPLSPLIIGGDLKISHVETLISIGSFSQSQQWQIIRQNAIDAIKAVHWPPGTGSFTIYPESGKKRGQGNGVKPIKEAAIIYLVEKGWRKEHRWPLDEKTRPGKTDAAYLTQEGTVVFEWETGNISSSHRSLNKMALGLLTNKLVGGILVIPSRKLYKFLTDRVGNYSELEPYFPLWRATPCENGVLEIMVIEHDGESLRVPRIPKGTDGRAMF